MTPHKRSSHHVRINLDDRSTDDPVSPSPYHNGSDDEDENEGRATGLSRLRLRPISPSSGFQNGRRANDPPADSEEMEPLIQPAAGLRKLSLAQPTPLPASEQPKTRLQKISDSLHSFFRKYHSYLLYLKILPSILLLGAFGRRPITIAKLAAPGSVESFSAFVAPLLAPILFLGLIDTIYITITIFQENWELKEYTKTKNELKEPIDPHELTQKVEKLRAWAQRQTSDLETLKTLIQRNIYDKTFKNTLDNAKINEDIFLDQLIETNHYKFSPHGLANTHLTKYPARAEINYTDLWLQAQFDLTKHMYTVYQDKCIDKDPESQRIFILNNIASPKLRSQLNKLNIDENKFVEYMLTPGSTVEEMSKLFKPGVKKWHHYLPGFKPKPESFDYATEWFKTEIRLARKNGQIFNFPRLNKYFAIPNGIDSNVLLNEIRATDPNTTTYEYDASKIVKRFDCMSTKRDFNKEYPILASILKYYDKCKKVLIFPLRAISLGLAIEALFPVALPLALSLPLYAGIGFVLSMMIIILENYSDAYLKTLKSNHDQFVQKLHQNTVLGILDTLDLKSQLQSQPPALTRTHTAPGSLCRLSTIKQPDSPTSLSSPGSAAANINPLTEGTFPTLRRLHDDKRSSL